MPDEKDPVVTPDESVMITDNALTTIGRPIPKPLKAVEVILRVCQIIGMALVILLMFLTVAHVIGRYIFNYPMLGVVEVSGLMVITLVFLASPYDFLIDRHIGVDVIARRLPLKTSTVVNFITHFMSLVVMTLALIWTIRQGYKISLSGARTSQLHIPEFPFYYVVAFGWFLSVVSVGARLALFIMKYKTGRAAGPTDATPAAATLAGPADGPGDRSAGEGGGQ